MVKRKSKSKSSSKKKALTSRQTKTRERVAKFEDGLLGRNTKLKENRHVKIALAMASLIAGLLLVINLDRSTNSAAATRDGGGTSFHGWPAVYLERRHESLSAYLMARKINPWPFPIQEGEVRRLNLTSLWIDIGVGCLMVACSYFLFRFAVLRYDNWKKTWT